MFRFLETIAIVDGGVQRLPWHQRRVDETLRTHGLASSFDLQTVIGDHPAGYGGRVKCRILYDLHGYEVQLTRYEPREIRTLKVLENNDIRYPFKFTDRAAIDEMFGHRGACDDILIMHEGLITDCSIANIVFRRGDRWITPHKPLLNGTMRSFLLDHGMVTEAEIRLHDLSSFESFKPINALMAFAAREYPVSNIHF